MAQKCAKKQNILTVNILDKHTKLTNTAEVFCCILCLFGGIIVCSSACQIKTTAGECCVFPFVYRGKTYSSCTTANHGNTLWCATTADYDTDKRWGDCAEGCNILHFTPHRSGQALRDHVIRAVEVVDNHGNCNVMCSRTEYCISFNLGPPLPNGMRICELSHSDHIRDPEDLVPRDGFLYSATQNACSSGPCVANSFCKPNFAHNHYTCVCKTGFQGRNCTDDVDECSSGVATCDVNARCSNTVGSYNCTCREGFLGDGKRCTDVDECSSGAATCDVNARCQNTVGSYNCICKEGFPGDGKRCTDVDECSSGAATCDVNARCSNTVGSYSCTCKEGFLGDGKRCTGYIARIDIASNGNSDPVKVQGFCIIKINGVEYCPRRRGHNVVARLHNGAIKTGHFDTFWDKNAGKNLAAWISALPIDTVVLVAVGDDGSKHYMDAAAALKSVGAVDPLTSGFRSSWYLIGYKGAAKSWIRQGTAARGKGPSKATVENIYYSN